MIKMIQYTGIDYLSSRNKKIHHKSECHKSLRFPTRHVRGIAEYGGYPCVWSLGKLIRIGTTTTSTPKPAHNLIQFKSYYLLANLTAQRTITVSARARTHTHTHTHKIQKQGNLYRLNNNNNNNNNIGVWTFNFSVMKVMKMVFRYRWNTGEISFLHNKNTQYFFFAVEHSTVDIRENIWEYTSNMLTLILRKVSTTEKKSINVYACCEFLLANVTLVHARHGEASFFKTIIIIITILLCLSIM
jgi:hypothetical protein